MKRIILFYFFSLVFPLLSAAQTMQKDSLRSYDIIKRIMPYDSLHSSDIIKRALPKDSPTSYDTERQIPPFMSPVPLPSLTGKKDTAASTPAIYLTFDDGPHPATFVIANIATKEEIPISFFTVGLHYEMTSPKIREEFQGLRRNRFVEIDNHSYTHAYRNHYREFYSDVNGAVNDVEKCQSYLRIQKKIVRLPGSNTWRTPVFSLEYATYYNRGQISADLVKNGYYIFGWDGEWHFNYRSLFLTQSADYILKIIEEKIANHTTAFPGHFVLLMHDRSFIHEKDQTSLLSLIQRLKAKGYRFEFISRHPLMENKRPNQAE